MHPKNQYNISCGVSKQQRYLLGRQQQETVITSTVNFTDGVALGFCGKITNRTVTNQTVGPVKWHLLISDYPCQSS